jgi:hypothetical protein
MYITPKKNIDINDCRFYHTFNFDGKDKINAKWDLTNCIDDYLSNFDFKGKRVIDIGSASGYLSFEMEKKGADVVSFDMPDGSYWDHLIYPGYNKPKSKPSESLFNSYEYIHEKLSSKNKIFRANIYEQLPDEIGYFDVAVFGTMLSHVRDPILTLMNILLRVKDHAILINPFQNEKPTIYKNHNGKTWWMLCQEDIEKIMFDIGFQMEKVTIVKPMFDGTPRLYKSILFKRCSYHINTNS